MRLLRQDHPGRAAGLYDLREENEPGEPVERRFLFFLEVVP